MNQPRIWEPKLGVKSGLLIEQCIDRVDGKKRVRPDVNSIAADGCTWCEVASIRYSGGFYSSGVLILGVVV